jgi:hypothetical protein
MLLRLKQKFDSRGALNSEHRAGLPLPLEKMMGHRMSFYMAGIRQQSNYQSPAARTGNHSNRFIAIGGSNYRHSRRFQGFQIWHGYTQRIMSWDHWPC